MIKHEGNEWVLYTKDGSKVLGKHPTEEKAKAQEEAIKASEAAKNSAILVSNIDGKTQIESDGGKYRITRVPVCVDDSIMNNVYYPAVENRKALPNLVGKPFTIGHPSDDDGNFISAREGKGLMDYYSGGVVTNAYNERRVNYVDLEIDQETLKAQDKEGWMFNALESKENMGVSTGLFFDANDLAGDGYNMTAINQEFDHLAGLHADEPPAGGDATFMRFNSADRSRMVFVNQHLPTDEDRLIDKLLNRLKPLFATAKPESYNNKDGSPEQAAKNQPDGSNAVDKKQMMSLMKNMGMDMSKVNEDMDEKAMYNMMDEYTKNMGSKKNEDEKMEKDDKSDAKNSDATLAAINALSEKMDAINDRVVAVENKDDEKEMLANFVHEKVGIGQAACNAMSKEELTKLASTQGYINANAAASQPATNSKSGWDDYKMFDSEAK